MKLSLHHIQRQNDTYRELMLLQLLDNWIKTWNKPNQCPKIQRKKIHLSLTTTTKSPNTSAKTAQPQSHGPVQFIAISIPLWEIAQRSVYCYTTTCIFTHLFTNHIKSPLNSELMNRAHTVSKPASHCILLLVAQLNFCVRVCAVEFTHMQAKGIAEFRIISSLHFNPIYFCRVPPFATLLSANK